MAVTTIDAADTTPADTTDTPAPEAGTAVVDTAPIEDDADGTSADATTDDDEDLDDEKFDKVRAINKINKVNAEARNLRKEVKRLREIEVAVKADEDAKKSDLDRAIARAEAAETKLKDAERQAAVMAVKDRFDLPAKVLAGLEGKSIDELIESAEEWAAELGIEDKTKRKPRAKTDPKDLNGGRDPHDRANNGRTVESVVADLQLWR